MYRLSLRDVLFFVASGLAILVFIWVRQPPTVFSQPAQVATPASSVHSDWQMYRNERFQFQIQYPPNWTIEEADDALEPRVTLTPVQVGVAPAKRSPTASVVIYPRGTPGVVRLGAQETASIQHPYALEKAINFTLNDGSPWASEIHFLQTPSSWGPYSFIWLEAGVEGYIEHCQPLHQSAACDPLFGDNLIRDGAVSKEDRQLTQAIFRTFRFIQTSATTESDEATVASPRPDSRFRPGSTIRGQAPLDWFFEGHIGVSIYDSNNIRIGHTAIPLRDPESGSFNGTVRFANPETSAGSLHLERANPTGDPNVDAAVIVPVIF